MTILILGNVNHVESVLQSSYDLIQDAYDFGVQIDTNIGQSILVISDVSSIVSSFGVSRDIESIYSIREFIFFDVNIGQSILVISDVSSIVSSLGVSRDIESKMNLGGLETFLESIYSIRFSIETNLNSIFDLSRYKDHSEIEISFSIAVSRDIESKYRIRHFIFSDTECFYLIKTFNSSDIEGRFDILNTDIVSRDIYGVYTIYDPTSESLITDVIATIDGQYIDFDSISISTDESSYCWTLNAQLSNEKSWVFCLPGSTLSITIGTDEYLFIIDTRDSNTSFNNRSYSINARSITSIYGEGADPIHDTWNADTTDNIINGLISTPTEINIESWNLTDDILVAEGDTPIAIVKKISEARGGILYTKGDGTLVVEKKYKQDPPDYNINNYDHTISDLDDIYNITESRTVKPGYNQVEVSDEPDSNNALISITLKEGSVDKLNLTAILIVRIYPFMNYIELVSSHDDVDIPPSDNPIFEEVEEMIEIIDGSGLTSFAVFDILSYSYQDDDMGNIRSDGSTIITEISGTTLLNIKYRTQYHEMRITVQDPEKIQVYMED
jgi:hypothetical protein